MNKILITVTVVAACIATIYGIPVPQAVNWTDVAVKVGEIEIVVRNATNDIKTVANNDNEQVGSTIGSKVDNYLNNAKIIFERVNTAIADESLTEVLAQTEISTLKGSTARLIGSLQGDLIQLTPTASEQILDLFSALFDSIDLKAEELFVLLQQGNPTSTTLATTVPSTTLATTVPSTTLATTVPSTTLATTVPSTTLATTVPSTTLATTVPSTTLDTIVTSS